MVNKTDWETAQRCPMCGQLGIEMPKLKKMARSPSTGEPITLFTFHCDNSRCVWNGTGWVVQVNKDGTIPVRENRGGDKAFPDLTPGEQTAARDYIRGIVAEDGTQELADAWRAREGEDIEDMK